jgi:hypothetical protein
MDKDDRKKYNAIYYAQNKDRIIKTACEKVVCDRCGRTVIFNNIKSHQKSKICVRKANVNKLKPETIIQSDVLKIEINEANFQIYLEKLEDFIDRVKQTKTNTNIKEDDMNSDLIPKDIVKNKIKLFERKIIL